MTNDSAWWGAENEQQALSKTQELCIATKILGGKPQGQKDLEHALKKSSKPILHQREIKKYFMNYIQQNTLCVV